LFPDLSEGRAKLRATYRVVCAKCGQRGVYESETLERYQHPPDAEPLPFFCVGLLAFLVLIAWFGWLRLSLRGGVRLSITRKISFN
jgi:hypothetical protein